MEPEKFFSDRTNQTLLQQAELAAILRMLSISEGTFSLSIAICNSPVLREYLISKITEQKAGIEKIPIEKNCTDMLAFAEKKITIKRPSAIFITEIENALPSDDVQPRIIRNLNASRELWQQKFSCPVVFWLPEYAATMLQRDALDFASWLSHIFEFVSEQATAMAGTLDSYAGDITSAGKLDANKKRFRIAELEQRIEDAGKPPKPELSQHVLIWLNELAYIYKAIGDLDTAEESIQKSLHIAEKLGNQATIATDYGNLGLIYRTRGDLDKAEQMHKKSLEIEEKLGRLEGMASDYGNLGLIYLKRGDMDKAEQMHTKSLEINEKLGRFEGMAIQYGNLGVIHLTRGYLDRAEQMFKKALEIDEKLGRLNGMANHYGNLGTVYKQRGDIKKAREYWEKALELFKKIGMKSEIEKTQRFIDELNKGSDS